MASYLIVGEEPCMIIKIVEIMSESSGFPVLCSNWQKFARRLRVPEVNILELKNDLRQGVNNLEGLLVDLLYNWKGRLGNDASLEVLLQALTACHIRDIADKLESEFDEMLKVHILATGEVSAQDHVIKINNVFTTTADIPPEIVKQFRKSNPKPIQILNNFHIPNRPTYYIQRTLSPRTRLNTHVFKSASSDVFVLENLDWSNLDDTLFGSNVERSSRQTLRVTAKFILLDFKKDYERICQVVTPTSTPVHQVRFDSGSYYWIRSRGSLALIQQHVSTEQAHWSEEQFVAKHLDKFENTPVCIADTPGMGKSVLLSSIAQRVKETHTDRVVLYLVLRELEQSTNSQAVDLLYKQIARSDCAAKVLERLMEMNKLQFELFLDGFDEVLPIQIHSITKLLLSLKRHKNIRVHVTTRPHMRNRLEETLGVLGYTILPFSQDNQVDFLTKFWGDFKEHEIEEELDDSRLKSFATQCLEMLKKSLNEQEQDIAGIPLQCSLLAKVYAYDAAKYSIKHSETKFELTCKVDSIFQMYQQLKRKKMKRIKSLGDVEKQQLLNAHVLEAIKLIFPSWAEKLICIQNITAEEHSVSSSGVAAKKRKVLHSGYTESFLAKLHALGLMEPSSKDDGDNLRFVHRTFAEFLIAEHLVKHLIVKCVPCSQLQLEVVLGALERNEYGQVIFKLESERLKVTEYQFRQNTIAHFVNAQLLETLSDAVRNPFQADDDLRSCQNVGKILTACCLNNYANIFHLLSKAVRKQVDSDAWAWTDMALLAARYSDRNLMEQLIQLIQCMEGKHLSKLEFPKENFDFPVTPLHVAVQRGFHFLTRYLVLDQIVPALESLPYLLHSCVYESSNDTDAIIKEKIDIIKLLVGRRKEVVHERLPSSNATPLLLPEVHVDLIQTLIEQGADVNAVDEWDNTVLHMIVDAVTPAEYTKVFNLLKSTTNFNLWDSKDSTDETPLYAAVENIEVEHSVLDQYSHLNVDFNHVIQFQGGYSVIAAAIIGDRTDSCIAKLEQLGADVNYLNARGESALHIAARHGNYDVARYLVTDKNFDVNRRDCKRQTPLQIAAMGKFSRNKEAIQALLIDNGAELKDPEYKWRPTPLYDAFLKGNGLSLEIVHKMEAKGLGPEHLALALEPMVKNKYIKTGEKGSEYSQLFRYFYEHGGRIQHAGKELEQHRKEFDKAIAINDPLLEQLKVNGNNEVVLDGIHSATDLYDRIISGNIQLESVMLALHECNQSEAVETIRELLRNKSSYKFGRLLPEVVEFISTGNNMLVVGALDLELCVERVIITTYWIKEYQEEMDLLPGTLCLVKVPQQQQQVNFVKYLGGLSQLPYRFIVVCENESLAVVVNHTCKVVRDHIKWDDLTQEYQDELIKGECIGFQPNQLSKEEFFSILKDESLVELMRNGRVSTDHLGRIVQHLVNQLNGHQLKLLESFNSELPLRLAEIMDAECPFDEDQAQQLGEIMKWTRQELDCVLWFVAARAVLNATFNNQQQQMEQIVAHVFEVEEDKEEGNVTFPSLKQNSYRFKHELLVFFIDWLVGRGYRLPSNFQQDCLQNYTNACLKSNAINLTNYLFSIPNERIFSIPGVLHRLVQHTCSLDASQLEVRVCHILIIIGENPGSVNWLNQDNLPPLLMYKIHVELIDLLIYTGANAFAVDQQGCNFVHYAAAYLSSEQFQQLVRYLVEHRLTQLVNARDSEQRTPLFNLIRFNSNPDPNTLQVLASAGADFKASDKNGDTVLFYALACHTSVETLQALVGYGADWRCRNRENNNLLHQAAWKGNLEATKYFVSLGLHVNSLDDALQTPLIYAVNNGERGCNAEVVKFLLEQNADVSATNNQDDTVLSLAVIFNRRLTVLEALVERGADWSWRNSHNNTLLQLAAIRGNLEAVKYFVRLGCNVNVRDNDLDTPLISAVAEVDESINNVEVVEFLLQQGADVNATNQQGHTALYYAQKREQWNVYDLLSASM